MERMRALYLHGLASSPGSAKASFFASELSKDGIELLIPDLNIPSFESLSIRAILEHGRVALRELLSDETILMGSSLGAFAALHLENEIPKGDRRPKALILLAPAFDFRHNKRLTPEAFAVWRTHGVIPVHHSGTKSERLLPFAFLEELETLPIVKPPSIPTLIIHGTQDEVIGVEHSRAFAASAPLVKLIEVPSNHEMLSAFDIMLPAVRDFLKNSGISIQSS